MKLGLTLTKRPIAIWVYIGTALVASVAYAATAVYYLDNPGYTIDGPASESHARVHAAPTSAIAAANKASFASPDDLQTEAEFKGAPGGPIWVVYDYASYGGRVAVTAVDANTLIPVKEFVRLQGSGAWQWMGQEKTTGDWISAGLALVGALVASFVWGWGHFVRTVRAGWGDQSGLTASPLVSAIVVFLEVFFLVGFAVAWFVPGWTRAKRMQTVFRGVFGLALLFALIQLESATQAADPSAVVGVGVLVGGATAAWLVAWFSLRPASRAAGIAVLGEPGPNGYPAPFTPESPRVAPPPLPGSVPPADAATQPVPTNPVAIGVLPPSALPTFASVGGMDDLKRELRATVGLVLAYPDEAARLQVDFNGILLFGPPGTGKTMMAKATAGEFGLNFLAVSATELISSLRGESARQVLATFERATANVPCLLFFDEFDAVARRRDAGALSGEDRGTLSQLLRSLEAVRARRDIIVMAATNDLEALDAAALRPGRFDRQVRVDLPDRVARRKIIERLLEGRPVSTDIDADDVAGRTEGLSAAAVKGIVDSAALSVLEDVAKGQVSRTLTQHDMLAAIESGRGKDRPSFEGWTWDDLILPEHTKRELMQLERLIEHPDRARELGVDPPAGALLYGPPGTGKTTIARVLAAQARCSFYPVRGSDIVSKWLGESEQNISDLFDRARRNAPSIVFMDEIDALVPTRNSSIASGAVDPMVNQLLQEIDGLGSKPGVFVLGATNRADILDPALLRGGRLGRQIEIPLPDEEGRCAMLKLFARKMKLAPRVSCSALAGRTGGMSGADLHQLCQDAALQAIMRDENTAAVTQLDFEAALAARRTS